MFLWTAFTIGLVGSLHCVGMCGPIALALPYQHQSRWRAGAQVLTYNLGRVLTYTALGVLIGALGRGVFLAGLQTYFSIGIGILMLIVALFAINLESYMLRWPPLFRLNMWVKKQMAQLLRSQRRGTLFSLGLLNGLLPCGLVYVAIVGALTSESLLQSAGYMAFFGMGTVPLMLVTALAGQFINLRWRARLRKLFPVFLILFGLLFIYRGMQFNIPADFRFWENWENLPMCH